MFSKTSNVQAEESVSKIGAMDFQLISISWNIILPGIVRNSILDG